MNPYYLIRPLLFCFPPETAHTITLTLLNWAAKLGLKQKIKSLPTTLMGLELPNPIGVAGGLDKNGDYIDGLAALGFGFIEVGTVTPKSQAGNPKPRLFRLKKDEALINRLGFANKGIAYCVENIKKAKYKGVIGLNIGKNFSTPVEEALSDYAYCLEYAYPHVSYFTVNLSSPNTPGLRDLLKPEYFENLLGALKTQQARLAKEHDKYVPLCVKISPDMDLEQVDTLIETMLKVKIDGVIATNTALAREHLQETELAKEAGGLSGAPLYHYSHPILKHLIEKLDGKLPVIASGGMTAPHRIQDTLHAGANAVQVYSGLVYHGPKLLTDI